MLKSRTTLVYHTIIIGALFFFMVHRCFFFKPGFLEYTASVIIYPFVQLQKLFVRPLQRLFVERHSRIQLEKMVAQLRAEKKELLAELVSLHSTLWYGEQTKELINFSARYAPDTLPCAQIIMKQCSAHEHSFLIDYGSCHGAHVDMVALYKNCIIGRISHVFPYYSKVICVTDPLCKIPVYGNSSHAKGIYEGMLNEHAGSLKFVSHLDTIEHDELIISSGEGVIFPQGFAIGKVHWFTLNGLQYDVLVTPLISLDDIDYCCLIKKGTL